MSDKQFEKHTLNILHKELGIKTKGKASITNTGRAHLQQRTPEGRKAMSIKLLTLEDQDKIAAAVVIPRGSQNPTRRGNTTAVTITTN
jgi:hypothetical protein